MTDPKDDTQTDRPTPPQQTPSDPNVADRRLSEEQKQSSTGEPDPPEPTRGKPELPDPAGVGEAG